MKTKRSSEAYILIDHRNSPGISPEFMRANRLNGPAVGSGKTLETAMIVCHACGCDVIINPKRTRVRPWCRVHDAYLCDNCDANRAAAGGVCVPLAQKIEQLWKKLTS
jgi:hypothetical protein